MKSLSLRFTLSYVLCLFAIATFFFRFHTESLVLWPQNKALGNPRIYTDFREGGFSTAEFFESDSAIAMKATLNSGLYHPHAGIEFPLTQGLEALSLEGRDFSHMDSVAITFRSNADIALVLYTADPVASKAGDVLSLRPVRLDIPATRHYTEHREPLSKARTNKLWFDIRGVEPDSLLYLNHVVQIAVETGKGALLGLPTEIEIEKLEFFGSNERILQLSLCILIIVTGIYIWGTIKVHGKRTATRKDDRDDRLGKHQA
ncbi:MAG: hypothetical protein K6A31_08545 [Fibrobacter sp.]|nr:hypothetical protein [Fibrobacter sp.]